MWGLLDLHFQTIYPIGFSDVLLLKAGVYDLGYLKVASPPNSSPAPLCSVRRHAPSLWAPFHPPFGASYRHTSLRRRTSRQTTNSAWLLRWEWHQSESQVWQSVSYYNACWNNVALSTHYNVHSCQANVSVLACYWGNSTSVMSQLCNANYKQLALLQG